MAHPVLIIAAVAEELTGLHKRLGQPSLGHKAARLMCRGHLAGTAVHLLETGPGQINTARALTAYIESERPALVIQTGCAGGFDGAKLALGDIGIASREINAQWGIENPGEAPVVSPFSFNILKKGDAKIQDSYPMESELVENTRFVLHQAFAVTGVKVAVGPFITVSTITASDTSAEKYYRKYRALMENMEGAAAAHICIHYGIPFLEIRSVSNRVGLRCKKMWDLPLAFRHGSRAVYTVVEAIGSGKIRI